MKGLYLLAFWVGIIVIGLFLIKLVLPLIFVAIKFLLLAAVVGGIIYLVRWFIKSFKDEGL